MNCNWGSAYTNGIVVLAESLDMFRLGAIAAGGRMITSGNLFVVVELWLNPVRTSRKTQYFSITKMNFLILFNEVIPVYSENHKKPINTKRRVADC
jgi:hypothetical protein